MLRTRVPAGPPASSPEPAAPSRPRHRAGRAGRPILPVDAIWPLAAIVLVPLLGARAMQRAARSGEGRLAAEAFLLSATRDDPGALPLSPDGLGALHVAVYDTLTRVFDRADTLVAAGRELVVVVTVLAAVLLWRTARRLGFGHPAAAAAVLLAWAPALWFPVLLDPPAQLAVPWLLVAAWLTASGRPSPAAQGIAVLSAAVAALLAPDVLVLLLSGAVAALVTGMPRRATRTQTIGALLLVPVVVGAVLLLPHWDPEAVGLGTGTLLPSAAAFLVVGGLAAWVLERLRVPALALVATTLTVLLPSGRLSALIVCLPLAAVLTVGVLRTVVPGRTRRALGRVAAALLVGALVVTVVALVRAPAPAGSRAQTAGLFGWADSALPTGSRLVADRLLRAELLHAGGEPDEVVLPGTARPGEPEAPVLTVVRGEVPRGGLVLARFDDAGAPGPLVVVDPAPVPATPEDLSRRRALGDALLANPTTTAGGRAAELLRAGQVDPRLLSLLAALGAQFGVGVQDLPPAPGEPDDGAPARRALVDRLAADALPPGAPATERLLGWLDAQQPPFAPASVTSTDAGLLVEFGYVSAPDALVSGSAP